MTRLVALFFAAIALLLTAYWVVPGAKPPEMVAVPSAPSTLNSPIPPATLVRRDVQAPLANVQPALPASPAAEPTLQRAVRTADSGCDGDPIRCMLEGRSARPDPLETTGSIVPKKPVQKPAPKPVSRPQP